MYFSNGEVSKSYITRLSTPHYPARQFREKWRGRFSSFAMEESWLLKVASYVELNPVKAGMATYAWEYPWSSVHAHLSGKDDFGLVDTDKLLGIVGDWESYLLEVQSYFVEEFENHEWTGRPLGGESFIEWAGSILGRDLRKKKPGPKIKNDN